MRDESLNRYRGYTWTKIKKGNTKTKGDEESKRNRNVQEGVHKDMEIKKEYTRTQKSRRRDKRMF